MTLSTHTTSFSFASIDLVVTGASDGIGREFALQLATGGFNIVLVARNQAKLDAVAADIGAVLHRSIGMLQNR